MEVQTARHKVHITLLHCCFILSSRVILAATNTATKIESLTQGVVSVVEVTRTAASNHWGHV